MKLATLLFSFVAVVLLSSSMSLTRTLPTIGSEAPDFSVYNTSTSVRPADLKGKYIILNFWSYRDAVSRERNLRLARQSSTTGTEYIGVCVDEDRTLMHEILAQDGLDPTNQYMISDVGRGNPAQSYEVHSGLRAFEINPFGNIESIMD